MITIESMHELGASSNENVSHAEGSTITNPRLFLGCFSISIVQNALPLDLLLPHHQQQQPLLCLINHHLNNNLG